MLVTQRFLNGSSVGHRDLFVTTAGCRGELFVTTGLGAQHFICGGVGAARDGGRVEDGAQDGPGFLGKHHLESDILGDLGL